MNKETTVIATWGTLADSLSRAADIARPDSVPIGTCTTENIATEQAPIIRMIITVDLIPRSEEDIPF